MPKSRQYNNRLEIDDFPDILSKEDWIDLYQTLMAWGNRAAQRNKNRILQQQDSADKNFDDYLKKNHPSLYNSLIAIKAEFNG